MEETIAEIAKHYLKVPTLETRNGDPLDFYEVAVWSLKVALKAAYLAGAAHTREAAQPDQDPQPNEG